MIFIERLENYLGEALSVESFDQLQTSRNELIAFHSFLSTSKDKRISLEFAKQRLDRHLK